MADFLMIATRRSAKRSGGIEIYPKFICRSSKDLMIRGGKFYAVWLESKGLWSTDEEDAVRLIDGELDKFAKENASKFEDSVKVLHLWDAESGMIDAWHKFCEKQMWDRFHSLDDKLTFANEVTTREDYASKKLPYPLEPGDISAYDKLISTLYEPDERHKIEWAIGSIVAGDSVKLQKFLVLYGAAGTGKSTILNIIQQLFDGYYSTFDARALGSSSNSFALEAFNSNPLVAIQHDGDLSRIEDNTRLNSLVSHELMTVNEKFKSTYTNRFKCFLFMGTNRPVKITDAKSGLIRRLIDVSPSGNKLSPREYRSVMKRISFELGAIACHCRDVYLDDPGAYDDYIPIEMMGASNDFYNFVVDSYFVYKNNDNTTLKASWEMYKTYCEEARVAFPLSQRAFKEELKNYFKDYKERYSLSDGTRVRSYYTGFKHEQFEDPIVSEKKETPAPIEIIPIIDFKKQESIFDKDCAKCPAQYANDKGTPTKKWVNVTQTLGDISTSELHYVKPLDEHHIVIDFDIPDKDGRKCFELNAQEAVKWPPTYGELSKSGQGIHLHYIYDGDPSKLSRVFDDKIEVKVFTGDSSLRRKLTLCNNLPIAHINSGLPLKGEDKVIDFKVVMSEKRIRTQIKQNLHKEIHASTAQSVDFINKILDEAYESGMTYDVTDMRNAVLAFAAGSTHQADRCVKLVNKMHFKSDEPSENVPNDDEALVFYDVEVFPNLFLVNWKKAGEGNKVVRMINPSPAEIEELVKYRLVGFNCRRYDNHILYARLLGYTNEQLFKLSTKIVNGSANCFFSQAYNLSYTDVYDFSSKKQSLKKFEIELGIHHQELGLPWDQPVPEDMWEKVAEYCDNDVIATEAVFNARKADFVAREILASITGGCVNDTTNSLTTKLVFEKERKPQSQFRWRDLSKPVTELPDDVKKFLEMACPRMMNHTEWYGGDYSLLPYFPGYKHEFGKSTYRGVEVGEGGRVMANPGMYVDVALLDIASQHPHSAIAECVFGVKFTTRFRELVESRVCIKHEDWAELNNMLDGKLTPFVEDVKSGKMTSKDLATALKIAINSVYGLTAAGFDNAFRDPNNTDNIVAKRGALFMVNLEHEVRERGFTVAHIKTDSIKIPNATPEIIKFVMDYGLSYGYTFEHEATYDRMCLVNDAVYIAQFASEEKCKAMYGYVPDENHKNPNEWTATGTQFQVPYVFKTLFSKEPIEFQDVCETKSVTSALYLDMNEDEPEKSGDNLHFVGKVGQFCPIMPGHGGGLLVRESVDKKTGEKKYSSATGAKGYRWMESEMVKQLGLEEYIDKSFYNKLVDDAVENISQYGDFEWFVNNEAGTLPPWFAADDGDTTPFDVR